MNMKKVIFGAGVALFVATTLTPMTAFAEEPHVAPIRDYVELDVKSWLVDPAIVGAINAQNSKTSGFSEEEIITLDKKWRAQAKADDRPMINEILGNELSKFLLEKQEESVGLISEVFVMDAKGMNVGQSNETSDYWQGDEAKWQKTYLEGPDTLFVDEVEVDDSTEGLQSQASLSITDPATGKVIGAITLGFI
jgi:hypothetical protein